MKQILDCKTKEEVIELVSFSKGFSNFTEEEFLHIFSLCDAYWYHNGDPKTPHAELTSGWCSNGFFDCLRVLKYIALSEFLAYQLVGKIDEVLSDDYGDYKIPDWVIGSPMAGITFAHDVAKELGAPINMCVEKDPEDPKKKRMLWNRLQIPAEDSILQIEELTTTAQTLNEVERAIIAGNNGPVNFLPYVGILVHRPPKLPLTHYGNRRVIALIEKEIWAVPQEKCPLCAQGSKRDRPKQNWAKLTGKA